MPRNRRMNWRRISRGVLVDLPWVIDSSLRYIDFAVFRLWAPPANFSAGQERQIPQGTVLLCALNIFIIYGMTPDALCGVVSAKGAPFVLAVVALGYLAMIVGLAFFASNHVKTRIARRFARRPKQHLRRRSLRVSAWVLLGLLFIGLGLIFMPLWDAVVNATTCDGATVQWISWAQLLYAFTLCLASVALLWKKPENARFIFLNSLAAAVLFSLVFWSSGNSEANYQPYTTTLSVIVIPFIVIAMLSPVLAKLFIRSYRAAETLNFPALLKKTELFQKRAEPNLNSQRIWFAILAPVFHHLTFLLFWPSLAAIIAPIGYARTFFLIGIGLSYFFVFQSSITDRWNQILLLVGRLLMTGLPLVLSVVVIVLGILRFGDFQYVTIILDAAPFGALTMAIGSTYVLFWLFELAINRPVMVELLALFDSSGKRDEFVGRRETRIAYAIDASSVRADVHHQPRFLQVHGTGRFLVVGRTTGESGGAAWHYYNRPGLFQRVLAAHNAGSEREIAWSDLRRRIRGYFFVINFLVLLIFAAAWYSFNRFEWPLDRRPLIVVQQQDLAGRAPFSLKNKLTEQKKKNKPAILFAASGGGTRAALYSASVLQGLAQQGVGDDIVLLSGVSGGSASVAYFGANRQKLLVGSPKELTTNWHTFINSITHPFIEDVIEGSAEIHSILNLSHLLEKSMDRNLGLSAGTTLGKIDDVGLIFNSTVAGHPAKDASLVRSLIAGNTDAHQYVVARGGRMIFTNLKYESGLPGDGIYYENDLSAATRFHMMVVRSPDVRLTQAVTTTANFPAVFPNSGVWIEHANSESAIAKYSITDGGALDNRGVLSMLYMLKSTLKQMNLSELPEIHIVIADASAMSFDYSRDRGLAATFSASTKLQIADGLVGELLSQICREISNGTDEGMWTESRIGCKKTIQLHFLNMPTVFRSRGGIGTHWMMPTLTKLKDPAALTYKQASSINVSCTVLIDTIMALHASPSAYCRSEAPENKTSLEMRPWICGSVPGKRNPDPHGQSWQNIVRKLASDAKPWQLTGDDDLTWRHCAQNWKLFPGLL